MYNLESNQFIIIRFDPRDKEEWCVSSLAYP